MGRRGSGAIPWKFHRHAAELGQYLLECFDGSIWEYIHRDMKDGLLIFPIFPHPYRTLAHHLEVGYFLTKCFLSSVTAPFFRSEK